MPAVDSNNQQSPLFDAKKLEGARVWFIRHGETEAQIGKAAAHTEEIRLTALGKRQAADIAHRLPFSPTLIISSPYLRAWETASPTLQRFPGIPHELWQVQEFTYLGSLAGIYSTKQERRKRVEAYWKQCDPSYKDGNSESFVEFIQRARNSIEKLKLMNGFVTIFTHEQFIRAIQGLLHGWMEDTPEHMARFRQRLLDEPLPYGYILEMPVRPNKGSGQERFLQREPIPRSRLLPSIQR